MIKNLFTKHEHKVLAGMTKEQATQGAAWYWRSRQFGINFTSTYALTGAQYYSKLGLRQRMSVVCFEMGQGVGVEVDFSAELTDEGAVVGAVGAILVLPVAVAVGAVSYFEYENDANRMLSDFWTYMSSYSSNFQPPAGPSPVPAWAQGQQPLSTPAPAPTSEAVSQCPNCRASAEPDSRYCKHCGTRL